MRSLLAVRWFRPFALWLLGMVLVVAWSVLVAQPGPPGEWTRITAPTDSNSYEPALARTGDGVLHVVWLKKNGTKVDLMHTAVGADGKVTGSPATVLSAWTGISNPDLVVSKDGRLRVFFGGMRTTDVKDPYSQGTLYAATAGADGANWTLEKGSLSQSHNVHASPVGAAVMADGTPLATWAVSFALQTHQGLNPKDPDQKYQTTCCAYQPDIAVDAQSGDAVLGWYSNATKEQGLYTQTILPKAGERQFVPDSATPDHNSSLSLDQRMAITARIGAPGVYVAYGAGYPTYQTVNLWRHGTATPLIVAKAQGARHVNIAAGPEGRLWVMWQRNRRIYATRSNRAATRFGAIVEVAPPAGKAQSGIYKVKGEGSVWPLDLFVACQSINELATYHTQVLPGLSVSATPRTVASAQGGMVTLEVTDAGDPVPGAAVSVAGKTLTTDAKGRALFPIAKGSRAATLLARATKTRYTPGSVRFTVK